MEHQLLTSEISHLWRSLSVDCRQGECRKGFANFTTLGMAAYEGHGDEGYDPFHGIIVAGGHSYTLLPTHYSS